MHIKTLILSLTLMLSPLAAIAGGGHDHGHTHGSTVITQNKAESIATGRVMTLVEQGKIDASWKSATIVKSQNKMNGEQAEWVVTFNNTQVSDPAKDTLYIFLSTTGDYIAANFTGK